MELAGWCQSVMFAADLKGSTAVVNVKVEVLKEEDTLLKLEPMGESQTSMDPESKPLDRKRRRRPTAGQLTTPDTVSVISDLLPDDKSLPFAQPGTTAGSQVTEPKLTTLAGKRKRISTVDSATSTPVGKRTKGGSKTKTRPAQAPSVVAAPSTIPTNTGVISGLASESRQTSRRTERYASRCDKLEVEMSADT